MFWIIALTELQKNSISNKLLLNSFELAIRLKILKKSIAASTKILSNNKYFLSTQSAYKNIFWRIIEHSEGR